MLEDRLQGSHMADELRKLEDLGDVSGRRVLDRVDYNVKFKSDGGIKETKRIDDSLDTIKYFVDRGAKLILMTHNGRPEGKPDPKYSIEPVVAYLSEKLGRKVLFSSECVGAIPQGIVSNMNNGDVLLLQNLRFDPREQKNDASFAQELVMMGDLYVNDSFGTAHNDKDTSTIALPEYMKSQGKGVAAGRLMQREVEMLSSLLAPIGDPVAVMGGAKVSDKLKVLQQLAKKYDLCIGGAMANTFLKAHGYDVGMSLVEADFVDKAKELMDNYNILIPADVVVAKITNKDNIPGGKLTPADYNSVRTVNFGNGEKVAPEETILDIGAATVELYGTELGRAGTIIWNGPMGYFEAKEFSAGTNGIARKIAESPAAIKVAGGGESIDAVHASGYSDKIQLSTGGGAMLKYVETDGKLNSIMILSVPKN